jgi:PHD/YefM family antitoxin component YafN of YafNO toxin-antitoxin module
VVHLQPQDVHSLTDFQRNAKAHIARLKRTGRPELLTVNGKGEAVVLAPDAYARLTELAHEAEMVRGLREALDQADRGATTPLGAFAKKLRGKHGLRGSRH